MHKIHATTQSRQPHRTISRWGGFVVALGLAALALLISNASTQALPSAYVARLSSQVTASDALTNTVMLPYISNYHCSYDLQYAKNRFGVQVYGSHDMSSPYFCDLVASGATWVRNEISWASVEPTDASPPVHRWAATDAVFAPARQSHFNMIATINGNPGWAATRARGPIDKAPISRFADFAGALAERYDGDGIDDAPGSPIVEYFEFYNEPDAGNLGRDKRWGNYGKEYAEMLAAVYPAIKSANPNAKVLLGGLAYDWFEEDNGPFVRTFLDTVLANGGGNFFDIMNFHQYPPFAASWGAPNGPGLVEKTNAVRAKLTEFGYGNKPLVITESGAHSNDAVGLPMTPELQARYVTMLYTQVMASDVDLMVWFMFYDPMASYPYKNGLLTEALGSARPTRKLSFDAYRTAVDLLTGATFVRQWTPAETGNADLLAYQFTSKDGAPFHVAWFGPIERTDAAPLRVAGSSAIVRDIYGATRSVADADDGVTDGVITLQIGAQPAYIHPQP